MVDQEEARLENSEAILRNLVSEFKAQGIKIKVVDEDSIAYKGIQFDLLDSPTDTLNGVIYLESPSRQVIPIREENLGEGVESIMQYVESQKENPLRKWKKVKMSKNIRGHLDDADQIRQPIRDWYTSTYPDDDLGMNLSDITFHDLHTGISQGLDVYDHIGVGDSIVRERLFDRLAELKSVSYDAIYDMWLNGMRKGMRKSGKGLKKYAPNIKKLPNPVLLTYDNHTIEVPYQYDPYDSWDRRYTELDMGEFIVAISIASSDPFTEVQYHINVLDSQTRGGLDGADSYHGKMDIDYAISSGFHEVSDALDHAINGAKLSYIIGGAYWYHDEDNPLLPFGYYQYEDGEWVSKSKKLSKNMRKSMPNSRLVDKVAQIIEREMPNVSFVGDSMGYEPDIYDWVEGYIYETNQNVDEPWVDVESAEDLAEMILDSINGSYDSTVQTPNGDSIRMITKKLSKNIDRIRGGTHLGTTVYNPPNLSPQSNYYITDGRFYEVTSEHGVDSILDLTDDVQGGIFVPPVNRYNREFPDDDSIRGHIDSVFNLTKKSKKLSKNESIPSFSQMMKSVKDGSFKAKEISKGASAYAIFEIDGYDERLTRAQSLEGFYSPNVGGHIQTYERGIDVPVMGDVFVSASDIRSEMDYAIQGDFEEIKRGVCEAYDSVYNDVPIESIVFQGYAISNVFVVTEGVNSYARTFSISGGYSHIHLPLGAQIECEGSWYLDVLVTLRFEVNGELIVDSYESTISVDPVLRLHPQGIDAYNTLWESNDDMYM